MKRLFVLLPVLLIISFQVFAQLRVDTIQVQGASVYGVENLLIEVLEPNSAATSDGISQDALTYRIFVDLLQDYKLVSVSGLDYVNPPVDLIIESTEVFYNNVLIGSEKGQSANSALYTAFPSLEYDSYVADGRIGTSEVGVLLSEDSDGAVNGRTPITPASTPGGEVTIPVPLSILTDNLSTSFANYSAGWGIPAGTYGPDAATNIVFAGQLTTAGDLRLLLSISTSDPYGNLRVARSVQYPLPDPPVVDIISPFNGATYEPGSTVTITANASYANGIDSLVFRANHRRLGRALAEPYTLDWIPTEFGAYTLYVQVYDPDHLGALDSVQVTVSDTEAPVIEITSPLEGASYYSGEMLAITAIATDPDGSIDSVEFYINGTRRSVDKDAETGSIYRYAWFALGGTAHIEAMAWDNSGHMALGTVNILVNNPDVPSPAIVSPLLTDIIVEGDIVTFEATVTDDDNDVTSVEFRVDDINIGEWQAPPYTIDWFSVRGNHVLKVRATDARGLSSTTAIIINVRENGAPVASIKAPENAAEFEAGESVSIEVAAYDDSRVDSVEFFLNGLKIGVDDSPESDSLFSFDWISKQGTVKVKAVATDEKGLSGVADSVSFTVVNDLPVIHITSPEENENLLPGSELIISAIAMDPDGYIDSVQFMLNSANLGILYSEPYEVRWITVEGSYTIKVIVYDDDGAHSESTVRITVSGVSGISIYESNLIRVYPNPVHDILYLDMSGELKEQIQRLQLIDLSGRTMLPLDRKLLKNESMHIDMTGAEPGFYILVIVGSEHLYNYRITKY